MKRALIPTLSALLALLLLCGCTGARAPTPTPSPTPGVSASPQPSVTSTSDPTQPSASPAVSNSAPATTAPSAAVTHTSAPQPVATPRPAPTSAPVHHHSYTSVVTPPSCTTQGYTTYTCACGAHYQDHVTAALGHSFGAWVITVAPTASSSGTKVRTCTRCGAQESATISPVFDPNSVASQVVNLVNQERAKAGLSPLTAVGNLHSYAQTRSTELVSVFDHVRPDGSNPLTSVFNLGSYSTAGENIAMGYSSAQAVMDGWMNSPGHRANILNANFTSIGVGCYNHNGVLYWTQIFAG